MGCTSIRFLPRHARVVALMSCAALGSCVGTPTADPPDFLPTPRLDDVNTEVAGAGPDLFGPIDLIGGPGAVAGDADLWIVNLDAPDTDPQIIKPKANGSFTSEVKAAVGQRVRLVSRTSDRHSFPLDLIAVMGFDALAFSPLQEQGLACLRITPQVELDLGDEGSREESFIIDNTCDGAVTIERAVLRFAESKLAVTSPTSIAQGRKAEVTVRLKGELSEELWDILLLDVTAGAQRGRYALSVWAR